MKICQRSIHHCRTICTCKYLSLSRRISTNSGYAFNCRSSSILSCFPVAAFNESMSLRLLCSSGVIILLKIKALSHVVAVTSYGGIFLVISALALCKASSLVRTDTLPPAFSNRRPISSLSPNASSFILPLSYLFSYRSQCSETNKDIAHFLPKTNGTNGFRSLTWSLLL